MLEHHDGREEDGTRVRFVLAGNVGCCAVGCLKDGSSGFVVDVGSRRDSDASDLCGEHVRNIVAIEVERVSFMLMLFERVAIVLMVFGSVAFVLMLLWCIAIMLWSLDAKPAIRLLILFARSSNSIISSSMSLSIVIFV